MISPVDMLLFAAVIQNGSFTKAGRQYGISKQAVSERITKLETALGVRLLHRTTRVLKVTEEGDRYYKDCVHIAQQIEQANSAMQTLHAEPRGRLVVSAPIVFGRDRLLPAIQDYVRRHPKVRVEVRLSDRLVSLVEEGVDIALRVSHMPDSELSARRLGEAFAYFAASPALLANYPGISDSEIVRHAPAITFRDAEIWDLPRGDRLRPKSSLMIDDLLAVSMAAQSGLGVARLPGILCKPLEAAGALKILFGGEAAIRFAVYAVYASKKQLAPKIRSFIDTLIEHRADFTDAA